MKLVPLTRLYSASAPLALFDAGHGQANWAQTGLPSRELHTNFAGLAEILCRRGLRCQRTGRAAFGAQLATCRLLVIPPPTGTYDARKERWRFQRAARFTREEVRAVLGFVRSGGRLLAFGYRFGDSFTETNLGDLCLPLGGRFVAHSPRVPLPPGENGANVHRMTWPRMDGWIREQVLRLIQPATVLVHCAAANGFTGRRCHGSAAKGSSSKPAAWRRRLTARSRMRS